MKKILSPFLILLPALVFGQLTPVTPQTYVYSSSTASKPFCTDGSKVISTTCAAGIYPTFNQSTTGSAATLTTPRAINGVNFDGSAPITVTAAAGTLTGTTLNATVVTTSITSTGTLIGGATGSGFTLAFGSSTMTGQVPIANGGTAASTKAGGFDALSPMSASGDIIYGGTSGTGTRLPKGSDGQYLSLSSGIPAWASPTGTYSLTNTQTYAGGTTYAANDEVIYLTHIYVSKAAGNVGNTPAGSSDSHWGYFATQGELDTYIFNNAVFQ